jgi:hypothetical protein
MKSSQHPLYLVRRAAVGPWIQINSHCTGEPGFWWQKQRERAEETVREVRSDLFSEV